MSNVEIYDSSNSQLSSDEYSHDVDDDALMDAAVIKQQTPTKPKGAQKSHSRTSTETSPAKSSSAATTPRKLSSDLDGNNDGGGKAKLRRPASRNLTRRQIQQQQDTPNLYFKRRSIKW